MRWERRREEILAALDRALMSNEVAAKVDLSPSHTRTCLYRLENEGLIERIERDIGYGKTWIWWKRRSSDQ